MNMKLKGFYAVACVCAAAVCPSGLSARELTVKTVDAFTGVPVPGITVKTTIFYDQNPGVAFTRTADGKGEIRLKRREFTAASFFVAETERNYATVNIGKDFDGKEDVEFHVPVALKGKPAKLKIAEVKLNFPPDKDEMRFDFLKGDWLPPEGKGEVADVVFRRMPRIQLGTAYDAWGKPAGKRRKDSLSVKFPGEGNRMDDEKMETITSGYFQKAQCFRIRAQKDENGSVTNCFYGKIYGEFEWFPDYYHPPHIKEVKFTYYINETPMDRDLETDRSAPAIHNIRP